VQPRRPIRLPHLGGGLQKRRERAGLELLASRIGEMGVLVNEGMSMREIVGLQGSGGTGYDPMRVIFSEGSWEFGAGGFELLSTRNDIQFVVVAPGYTEFRRQATVTTASLFTVSAAPNFLMDGIRINDASTLHPAVTLTSGIFNVIANCYFTDCLQAIKSSARGGTLRFNMIENARDTGHVVHLDGGNRQKIVGNECAAAASASTFIRADDAVDHTSFVNNIHHLTASYVVDYLATGRTSVAAGNVGTVNAR
jgi:hypothetical protein